MTTIEKRLRLGNVIKLEEFLDISTKDKSGFLVRKYDDTLRHVIRQLIQYGPQFFQYSPGQQVYF